MRLFRFFVFLQIVSFKGFLFLKSTEKKSFSDIVGFPLDKYEKKVFEICQFTNFCTQPAQTNYTYYSEMFGPCCPQCSCDPNCFVRSDCCIDALLSTETYNFDIVDHISCNVIDINANIARGNMYNLVASCSNDKGEKISCAKTIDEKTRPEEFLLVSSKDGFVIFLNEDCARCHGVSDIIRWKFTVRDCKDDLFTFGLTGKAMFSYAMKNCTVFSQPPDDLDVSDLKCSTYNEPSINKCEEQDDDELKQLCDYNLVSQFDQRQLMFGMGKLSKNVFCYMCNVPNNHTFFTECFMTNDLFTPLSYILNLDLTSYEDTGEVDDESSRPGDTDPNKYCHDNEFRDPFFDICRQLECPFPNRTKFHTCTKPPVVPVKPTLPLSFTIHIEQTVKVVELFNLDTKFQLTVEDFSRISNLTQCKYITFKQTYYVSKSNHFLDYIIVDVEFRRTNTCQTSVLHNIFPTDAFSVDEKKSFRVLNMTVQNYTIIGNFPVSSLDVLNYSFVPEVWLYDIQSYTKTDTWAINFEESKFYFVPLEALQCPYIYLNEIDYVILASLIQFSNEDWQDKGRGGSEKKKPKVINGFTSREYHTSGETKRIYFVCIETYTSLTLKSSITKDRYPTKGIVTLTLSIPSIICIIICFVVYSKTANTRSLPSKLFRLGLCNLLIAQGVFQFGVERTTLPFPICASIGALAHFFWLSAVFSLNAFCVLVAVKLHVINDGVDAKSGIVKSLLFVYGLSALFVGGNVIYSRLVSGTIGYGLHLCYIDKALMRMLFFALPIFCTVVLNCCVYLYIIYAIASTSAMAGRKSNDVKYATLYFRLLLLTGVAWMFGFLNEYFSSDVLDYCFIILIGGQGLFLFFAFYFGRIWSTFQTCARNSSEINANLK